VLVTDSQFLLGYGAARPCQARCSLRAYLGAVPAGAAEWLAGGCHRADCDLLAGLLLVFGSLPFWERLRMRTDAQSSCGA
jgi:chromate transporter